MLKPKKEGGMLSKPWDLPPGQWAKEIPRGARMHEGEGIWKSQESRETIRKEVRSTSPGHCHQYTNMCMCFWPVNKKETCLDSTVLPCYHPCHPKVVYTCCLQSFSFHSPLNPFLKDFPHHHSLAILVKVMKTSLRSLMKNSLLWIDLMINSQSVSPGLPAPLNTADYSHPLPHSLTRLTRCAVLVSSCLTGSSLSSIFHGVIPLLLLPFLFYIPLLPTSPCGGDPGLQPGSSFLIMLTSWVISSLWALNSLYLLKTSKFKYLYLQPRSLAWSLDPYTQLPTQHLFDPLSKYVTLSISETKILISTFLKN